MSTLADSFAQLQVHVTWMFSRVGMAAMRFKKKRLDYYQHLADLIRDSAGKLNLLQMFQADAERYAGKPRGILAAHWAHRFQENGADLVDAWRGTIPSSELMVIQVAQASGSDSLEQALRDVRRLAGVADKAQSIFLSTTMVGLIGLVVAAGVVAALPLFAEPMLRTSFGFVPVDKWGPTGQRLLALSAFVRDYGVPILVLLVATVSAIFWSLANFTGPVRKWLDDHVVIYKVYRDFQGAMFLSTCASLVRRRGSSNGLRLRDALTQIEMAATPWLRWHTRQVIDNIDQTGALSPTIFSTGVLDEDNTYYLQDVVGSNDFDVGMHRVGMRLEERVIAVVSLRAGIVRWFTLLLSVLVVGAVTGMSTTTILEMKSAITASML